MAKRGKVKSSHAREETAARPFRPRKYEYHILIVCEDENTEPAYFGRFKAKFERLLPKKTVFLFAKGTGRNSLGVVNYAVEMRRKMREDENLTFEQTWAVFDKDDLDLSPGSRANFEEAFKVGESAGVSIAYSNECFELWLLLHFTDVSDEQPIPRKDLYAMLEAMIQKCADPQFKYEHGNAAVLNYVQQYGNEAMAIQRAETLDIKQVNKGFAPIERNPDTRVYKLVQELTAWYDYYAYEP